MATVAAAVQRVSVRVGLLRGVVGVAHQVVAAQEFLRVVGTLWDRVGGFGLLVGFLRAGAAQVGVSIVNAGIEYHNLHALTGVPGRGGIRAGLRVVLSPHREGVGIEQ